PLVAICIPALKSLCDEIRVCFIPRQLVVAVRINLAETILLSGLAAGERENSKHGGPDGGGIHCVTSTFSVLRLHDYQTKVLRRLRSMRCRQGTTLLSRKRQDSRPSPGRFRPALLS